MPPIGNYIPIHLEGGQKFISQNILNIDKL